MESTTYNRRMGGSRYQPNDEMSSDIPVDSERITDAPAVAAGSPLSSRLFTPLVESIVNDSLRPLHLSLYLQEARRFADESGIDSLQIVSDFASYHPDDDSERISSINHSFRAFRADKSRKTYTSTKRVRRKNDQVGRHAQKLSEFSEVYEFGHHLDLSRPADAEKYLAFLDCWMDDLVYPTKYEKCKDFVECWLANKPYRLHSLRILANSGNKVAWIFLRLHSNLLTEKQFVKRHPQPAHIEKQGFLLDVLGLLGSAAIGTVKEMATAYVPSAHLVNTYTTLNRVATAVGDAIRDVLAWIKEKIDAFTKLIQDNKTIATALLSAIVLSLALFLGYLYARHAFPTKADEIRDAVLIHYSLPEKQGFGDFGPGYDFLDWTRQYAFNAPQRAFWQSVGVLPKLKSYAEAIRYFVENARDLYDSAVEAITGVPRPRTALEREVVAFDARVRAVKAVVDKGVSDEILVLADEIDSFPITRDHLTSLGAKAVTAIRPFVSSILMHARMEAEKCCRGLERVRIAAETRPLTVWLSMYGGQGTRKTTLLMELMDATHAYLIAQKASFVQNPFQSTDYYTWDPVEEYWDTYSGQFYTILDDFLQAQGVEQRRPVASRIISMIAPFAMPLTCADLNLKGRIFFRSRALITTTNVPDLYTADLGLESPQALESRRSIAVQIVDSTEGAEKFLLEPGCVLLEKGQHSQKRIITFDELVGIFAEALLARDREHHVKKPTRIVPKFDGAFASQRCYVPGTDALPFTQIVAPVSRTYTPIDPGPSSGKRRNRKNGPRRSIVRQGFGDEDDDQTQDRKGKEKEVEQSTSLPSSSGSWSRTIFADKYYGPPDDGISHDEEDFQGPLREVINTSDKFALYLADQPPGVHGAMHIYRHATFEEFCEVSSSTGITEPAFVEFLKRPDLSFNERHYELFTQLFPPQEYSWVNWCDEIVLSTMTPGAAYQQLLSWFPTQTMVALPAVILKSIARAFARFYGTAIFTSLKQFAECAGPFLVEWWMHYARRCSPLRDKIGEAYPKLFNTTDIGELQAFYVDVHTRQSIVLLTGVGITAFSISFGLAYTFVRMLMPATAFIEVEDVATAEKQTYDNAPAAKKPNNRRFVRAPKHQPARVHLLGQAVERQGQVQDRIEVIKRNLDVITLYLSPHKVSNTEALSLPPKCCSFCYAIGGTRYIIPMHVILELGDVTDVRYVGLQATSRSRFLLSDVKFIANIGGDFGIFEFPPQLSQRPSVTAHFATGEISHVKMTHLRPHMSLTTCTLINASSWESREVHTNPGDSYGPIHTDLVFHGIPNEPGLCGSPYLDEFGMIVGFHQAGDRRAQTTYAKNVFRSDIEPYVPKVTVFTDPIPGPLLECPEKQSNGVQWLGRVPSNKYASFINGETKLRESALDFESFPIPPTTDLPAALSPFTGENGERISPLAKAVEKITSQSVSGPAPDPLEDYSGFLPRNFNRHTAGQVVSKLDAIYGIPGLTKGIDMTKSIGYSLKKMGYKNRRQIFPGRDAEVPIDPVVDFMIENMLHDIRSGNPVRAGVIEESLKDEIRDRLRVKLGKTRLFSVYDLDLFVVTKMFFDMFFHELEKDPSGCPCTIGLNVYGQQWDQVYVNLVGQGNRVFRDGDFGSYDFSHKHDGEDEFCAMVCIFHEEPDSVRVIVALNVRGCWHVLGTYVFLRPWGMSSGSFLTSVMNTFVNWLYHAKAWRALHPNVPFSVVVCYFHGDDSLLSVPKEYSDYSCEYLSNYFRETYQMEYTASDKGAVREKGIDEITFLKRRFVPSPLGVLAPLAKESIANMIKWTDKDYDPITSESVIRSALIESFQHGRPLYDQVVAWARCEAKRLNLSVAISDFDTYARIHLRSRAT